MAKPLKETRQIDEFRKVLLPETWREFRRWLFSSKINTTLFISMFLLGMGTELISVVWLRMAVWGMFTLHAGIFMYRIGVHETLKLMEQCMDDGLLIEPPDDNTDEASNNGNTL